ncbi:MAG: serine/threonine-protein kinase [Myxococcota bacterium]|nr:serine/threonine-protein kinase [Myxococcota bacterium]
MSSQTFGRYSLSEKLGHGGMSVVHRAFDPRLERDVAIKILHPHLAERADSRARFSREARAVARLRHPNIVDVFDYASPQSQDSFIVTEFVDGPTLRTFAEEHPIRHPEAALLLMVPIIDALDRAHEAGIIHRDVKPENIMIRQDGSPVLLDFGIAQMIDMPTLTATGTMLGSPAHMAPEVIDGQPVGAPADIFSVGTTLYWLICGTLPFSGPNPSALFRRILEADFDTNLVRRPRAGRPLAKIVEQCLSRLPADRPTSTELRQSLTALLTSMNISDLKAEQEAFAQDPDLYQDALSQRLVPALTNIAEERLDAGRVAAALDSLDRALELAPGDTKALALVNGIERVRRSKERMQLLLLVLCGLIPISLGIWFYQHHLANESVEQTQATEAQLNRAAPTSLQMLPIPTQDAETTPSDTDLAPDADGDLGGASERRRPDASVSGNAVIPPDTKSISASMLRDATAPINQAEIGVKTMTTARRDGGVQPDGITRSRPSGSSTRRASRKRIRRVQPPPLPDTETPSNRPLNQVRVRVHSALKGAMVFVNDEASPQPLYRLEVAGGILLDEGTHTVRFQNPGCSDETRKITIERDQRASPPLVFKCRPRPSTIRIACSPPSLEIRRADNGRLLGQTNQDISIPMKALRSRIALTIGTPGGRFAKRVVDVQAGQRSPLLRLKEEELRP